MVSSNRLVVDGMPRRMLEVIQKTLNDEFSIPATMNEGDRPAIVTDIGNIVYFQSSGDFRLFLKNGDKETFKSPEKLLKFMRSN